MDGLPVGVFVFVVVETAIDDELCHAQRAQSAGPIEDMLTAKDKLSEMAAAEAAARMEALRLAAETGSFAGHRNPHQPRPARLAASKTWRERPAPLGCP